MSEAWQKVNQIGVVMNGSLRAGTYVPSHIESCG